MEDEDYKLLKDYGRGDYELYEKNILLDLLQYPEEVT
jgi:hypothetical protein